MKNKDKVLLELETRGLKSIFSIIEEADGVYNFETVVPLKNLPIRFNLIICEDTNYHKVYGVFPKLNLLHLTKDIGEKFDFDKVCLQRNEIINLLNKFNTRFSVIKCILEPGDFVAVESIYIANLEDFDAATFLDIFEFSVKFLNDELIDSISELLYEININYSK